MASSTVTTHLRRGNDHLPFDILHRVFEEVAQFNQLFCNAMPEVSIPMDTAFEILEDPYELASELGHVCTSWRTAVLATSRLWGLIMIGPEFLWNFASTERGRPQETMRRLKRWVERGQETPRTLLVDLRFGMVPGGPFNLQVAIPRMFKVIQMMFKEVISVLKYWKSVHLEADNEPFAQAVLGELRIAAGAPNLESLTVSFPFGMPDSDTKHGWRPFQGDVPKLGFLSVRNVCLDWRHTAMFRNLLGLSLAYTGDMEDSSVFMIMPKYQQAFKALCSADKLCSLYLSGFVPQMFTAPEPSAKTILRLPALNALDLELISPDDIALFGHYLPFSTLSRLDLKICIPPAHRGAQAGPEANNCTEFMQMLLPYPEDNIKPKPWHDLSQLRHLNLRYLMCEEDDLILLFDAVTRLTHLEITVTKALRTLFLPVRPHTEEDNAVMGGQPKPQGYVSPLPVPKLRYLRAFGGASLQGNEKQFHLALAEGFAFRVKMGCRMLRQLIVAEWMVEELRANEEFAIETFTEGLCGNESTARFMDEYGPGPVDRDELE